MLSNKREKVKPIVYAVAQKFTWLHPNVISLAGMSVAFIIATLLTYQLYTPALLLFVLLPFDALDGAVAKLTNRETKFGLHLDNICDRIADTMLILGFGLGCIVRWPMVISALIFTLLISYSRASLEVAAGKRLKVARGFMQRTERIVMLAITLIVFIIQPAATIGPILLTEVIFFIMLAGSIGTFFFRIWESYQLLK